MNYISLKRSFTLHLKRHIPWKQTGVAIIVMLFVVYGGSELYSLLFPLSERLHYIGVTLFTVFLGAISYFYVLLKSGAFSYEELNQFPFSNFILRKREETK